VDGDACDLCTDGVVDPNVDIDALFAACQADSACINFVNNLSTCPD